MSHPGIDGCLLFPNQLKVLGVESQSRDLLHRNGIFACESSEKTSSGGLLVAGSLRAVGGLFS